VLGPIITISTNHISTTAGTAITPVTITNTGGDIYYYSIKARLVVPTPTAITTVAVSSKK
jgi:hypothetical protein